MNLSALEEVAALILERNKLQTRRQKARSKANRLRSILGFNKVFIAGTIGSWQLDELPKKYQRSGVFSEIKMMMKRARAEQLLAEADLHMFTMNSSKRMRELLKAAGRRQVMVSGTNKIRGLATVASSGQFMDLQELQRLADNFEFDNIILRGK